MTYVDTSVLLAHLLDEQRRPPVSLWSESLVTSRLTHYEMWVRIHAQVPATWSSSISLPPSTWKDRPLIPFSNSALPKGSPPGVRNTTSATKARTPSTPPVSVARHQASSKPRILRSSSCMATWRTIWSLPRLGRTHNPDRHDSDDGEAEIAEELKS